MDSDEKEECEENEEECEENNDDENEGEEDINTISNIYEELEGKEKKYWYEKGEKIPKPKFELAKNILAKALNEEIKTEVITMLQLKETFNSPVLNNIKIYKK